MVKRRAASSILRLVPVNNSLVRLIGGRKYRSRDDSSASPGRFLVRAFVDCKLALKLQYSRLLRFFAAPYRALLGASGLSVFDLSNRTRSRRMTSEDIESLVRAMRVTVDNLESGPVKQSMEEASTLVLAHAIAGRDFCSEKNEQEERLI